VLKFSKELQARFVTLQKKVDGGILLEHPQFLAGINHSRLTKSTRRCRPVEMFMTQNFRFQTPHHWM
jgi:hypothetical protein